MESESNNTDCDYLTCGRCLREFPLQNITNFIHHKKNDCDPDNDDQNKNTDSLGRQLYCSSCTKAFLSAWDMLQHAQFTHNFKIFFDANRQVRLETSTIPAAISTPSEDQNSFIKEAPEVTPSIEPALFPLKQEASEPTSPPRSTDQPEAASVDTSQEMQCCSSVVPKKRKQHMEASHSSTDGSLRDRITRRNEAGLRIGRKRTFSGNQYYLNRNPHGYGKYSQIRSSFGQNRLQYGQSRNHSSSTSRKYPSTIYIDVEHENPGQDPLSGNQENNKLPYHQEIYLDENEVKGADRKELGNQNMIGNSGSFILQPGTVFSIPFSYPVHSETTVSSASNPAVYTTCSTNTYPSEQCKSSSSLSSSSGEGNVTTSRIQGSNVQELNPSSNSKSFVTSQLIKNSSISNSQIPRSDAILNQGRHSLSRLSLGFARSAKMGNSSLQRSKENQLTLEQQARKRKYPTSRPFKCDQCDHAFNQRIHLKKHLSKHTGVKPFKCGQCDYSTVERSHLKVHIRIHTGEKPFKCTFCEYATAQNSTLKIHLKRHHGSHMYSCQSCGKQFAAKDSYMDHQAEHGSGSSNLLNPSVVIETGESAVTLNKHEPSRPQAEKNENINDSWPGGLLKK